MKFTHLLVNIDYNDSAKFTENYHWVQNVPPNILSKKITEDVIFRINLDKDCLINNLEYFMYESNNQKSKTRECIFWCRDLDNKLKAYYVKLLFSENAL
jgi:hypothetical protein